MKTKALRSAACGGPARPKAGRAVALLSCLLACGVAEAAPKTDIILLVNGDRLTGEIKHLSQGILSLSTDTMDTVNIKWEKVRALSTQQYLQVELLSGRRYYGTAPDEKVASIAVSDEDSGQQQALPLGEIARIDPIERGELLQRLKGNFSLGYNFTKASNVETLTFSGQLRSRTDIREWELDGSANVTAQSGPDATVYDFSGSYSRFLAQRKYYVGRLRFESNTELGLDLRTSLAGGIGYYVKQDAHQELSVVAGLAANDEQYAGESKKNSLDAIIGTSYSYYRVSPLNADIDFTLALIPSLTESGRVRSEANAYLRWELVDDLYFELSMYGTYDSQPGVEANSEFDYGTTTSIGYSF